MHRADPAYSLILLIRQLSNTDFHWNYRTIAMLHLEFPETKYPGFTYLRVQFILKILYLWAFPVYSL